MSNANTSRKVAPMLPTPVVDKHGVTRYVHRDAKSGSFTTAASTRSLKEGGHRYADVLRRLADK